MQRRYYNIEDLTKRWKCENRDVIDYALQKRISLYYLGDGNSFHVAKGCTKHGDIMWEAGEHYITEPLLLSEKMLRDLFRTGKVCRSQFGQWKDYVIVEALYPIAFEYDDLVILGDDVIAFERQHQSNLPGNNFSDTAAEAECVKWLIDIMKKSPPTKPLGTNLPASDAITDCYRLDAQNHLRGLKMRITNNGFKRAVKIAHAQAGKPEPWCKAGRPESAKKINSPN